MAPTRIGISGQNADRTHIAQTVQWHSVGRFVGKRTKDTAELGKYRDMMILLKDTQPAELLQALRVVMRCCPRPSPAA